MTKANTTILAAIGAVVAIPAVIAVGAMWSGYVLSILWGWFVAPLGAPVLSVPMAIGLAGTVRLVTSTDTSELLKDPEKTRGFGASLLFSALWPALFLGMGWIVSRFL